MRYKFSRGFRISCSFVGSFVHRQKPTLLTCKNILLLTPHLDFRGHRVTPRHAAHQVRSALVGHDEVFARAMAADRAAVLRALGRGRSERLAGDRPVEEGYVFVDAHVLCTPIVADLDRDGADEVVFGVSYYFDKDQVPCAERGTRLDELRSDLFAV